MKHLELMRHRGRAVEAWVLLAACAAVFLLALLLPIRALGLTQEEETLQEAYRSGQVIRLHILADDDTARAQAIKLAVRDAVLDAFGKELAAIGITDAETAYAWLRNNCDALEKAAAEQAYACGFAGPVTAEVGILRLPPKQYGDVLLPEGEYRALRITLGRGEGQNWWCVLFPRLCLSLAGDVQTDPIHDDFRLQWHSLHILSCWPLFGAEAVKQENK